MPTVPKSIIKEIPKEFPILVEDFIKSAVKYYKQCQEFVRRPDVQEVVEPLILGGKFFWKVGRATNQIELCCLHKDPITGRMVESTVHKAKLENHEQKHIDSGGRILVVHVCGKQFHLTIS